MKVGDKLKCKVDIEGYKNVVMIKKDDIMTIIRMDDGSNPHIYLNVESGIEFGVYSDSINNYFYSIYELRDGKIDEVLK